MTPPALTSISEDLLRDLLAEVVGARGDLADLHADLCTLLAMIDALLTIARRMAPRAPRPEDDDGPGT